jgi:hypothetical protein
MVTVMDVVEYLKQLIEDEPEAAQRPVVLDDEDDPPEGDYLSMAFVLGELSG